MSKTANPAARTIALTLQRRIVDGTYPGGMPIRQAEVATEFGVSHIPVREALASLAQGGLVDIQPNRGAVVTSLSTDQCLELAEMRVALESIALKHSMKRLSAKDLAAARQALVRGAKADSLEERSQWNWEFHRLLHAGAARKHADRYLHYTWKNAHYEARSDSEHEELLAAVAAKDEPLALRLNKRHILGAATVAINLIKANEVAEQGGA
jgi:DNA-binding GntR family transcriptional regulator